MSPNLGILEGRSGHWVVLCASKKLCEIIREARRHSGVPGGGSREERHVHGGSKITAVPDLPIGIGTDDTPTSASKPRFRPGFSVGVSATLMLSDWQMESPHCHRLSDRRPAASSPVAATAYCRRLGARASAVQGADWQGTPRPNGRRGCPPTGRMLRATSMRRSHGPCDGSQDGGGDRTVGPRRRSARTGDRVSPRAAQWCKLPVCRRAARRETRPPCRPNPPQHLGLVPQKSTAVGCENGVIGYPTVPLRVLNHPLAEPIRGFCKQVVSSLPSLPTARQRLHRTAPRRTHRTAPAGLARRWGRPGIPLWAAPHPRTA